MNEILPPSSVVERWVQAMGAHDLEAAVAVLVREAGSVDSQVQNATW